MVKEFKAFLLRGNVVDLAVGVVIGAAFGAVVTSLVDNLLNPIIGLIGGQDFGSLTITLKDATATDDAVLLRYGAFISDVISFVLIAAAVFFLVVKPINSLMGRMRRGEEPVDEIPADIVLLTEIRDLLATTPSR
jgi:large conductance mechanosensitive channel